VQHTHTHIQTHTHTHTQTHTHTHTKTHTDTVTCRDATFKILNECLSVFNPDTTMTLYTTTVTPFQHHCNTIVTPLTHAIFPRREDTFKILYECLSVFNPDFGKPFRFILHFYSILPLLTCKRLLNFPKRVTLVTLLCDVPCKPMSSALILMILYKRLSVSNPDFGTLFYLCVCVSV
jgi:hypothetical protein